MEKPLVYLALGDSLTVGLSSFFLGDFVARYVYMSEKFLKRKVSIHKIAKNGLTTFDLLNLLHFRNVQYAIKRANIMTITIGGNDLIDADEMVEQGFNPQIYNESLFYAKQNIYSIVQKILYIKSNSLDNSMIRISNLYNPRPENPIAKDWIIDYNLFLKRLENRNVLVADLYSAFYGKTQEFLIFDDIHPNRNGYQVMANVFYDLGYYPFN